MPLLLTQAAAFSENTHRRGIIETFVQESSILDRLDFIEVEGNAYAYDKEATLPGVEFRAVNAAYSESTGTINSATESIVIIGGDADVDRFLIATRGNLYNLRAVQERMKVKALVNKLQDAFINGDTAVDANSFDGLRKRLTGGQVFAAGANGIPILGTTDAERHNFLDKLDELMSKVQGGPDLLVANQAVISKFGSMTRRLLIADQTQDTLGRTVAVYNGVPIVTLGLTHAGAEVLPQTETQGTAAGTTSSIYAIKFGANENDGGVTGLQNGAPRVDDLGELQTKPVMRTRIEYYTGLAVFGGKAAARMTGVLAS